MASCFPFVRRKQQNYKEVYLVILGLDNAGKTTTTRSIKGVSSDLVAPTIGFDRIEFAIDRFNINLYDLGGGRTIRDIWQNYFAEVHGAIFVVDSSAPDRLEECHNVLNKLFAHASISGKPILLLANKQDVEEAMDEADLINALELDSLANEYRSPCRLERCCALLTSGRKLDKGIRTGLRWLLAYIDSEWDTLDQRIRADVARQAREQALEREARRERVRLAREKRERLERERGGIEHSIDNRIVDNIPQNGNVGFEHGDASMVQVTQDDETDLAQTRLNGQVTVIDLENKARTPTTLQRQQHQKQRNSVTGRKSLDFTTTPEPILARESAFTPKSASRLSVPNTKTSNSLLNSHELRRQIQIACSIDLDPADGRKSSIAKIGEVMQIVELDEAEDGIQRPSSQIDVAVPTGCQLPASKSELNRITQKRTTDACASDIAILKGSSADQLGVMEPQTTETSLESVMEVCHTPKTGLVPPVIDTLYGRAKKPMANLRGSELRSEQPSDRPFSFLIVSSKDKRPSPITRLLVPNINRLHPKRRFSATATTTVTSVTSVPNETAPKKD